MFNCVNINRDITNTHITFAQCMKRTRTKNNKRECGEPGYSCAIVVVVPINMMFVFVVSKHSIETNIAQLPPSIKMYYTYNENIYSNMCAIQQSPK